jgi:hypothetical protein
VVDSLKELDPEWPIREAEVVNGGRFPVTQILKLIEIEAELRRQNWLHWYG